MVEYQGQFEKLLAKVGHLSQDRKVSYCLTGLRDSIRTDVQANRPTTLTMAIGLARFLKLVIQIKRNLLPSLQDP